MGLALLFVVLPIAMVELPGLWHFACLGWLVLLRRRLRVQPP